MKSLKLSLVINTLILSILFLGCSDKGRYFKTEGWIWNTGYHITYKGSPLLQDSILPVLNEVSHSLSVFEKNSLVSQLNDSIKVKGDHHLLFVYETSKKINENSQGRFDPTVSPLIDAWGFGIGHSPSADTLAIDSLLNFVGIQKTKAYEGFIVKEDVRTRFNFSAIAKGYGCDAVGEMFRRNGVNDYLVEIGGELTLSGLSPSGQEWLIAIDAPKDDINPGEETAIILKLTDAGIATSGNYRNYRLEGTQKLAHTISPLTGRPFLSEILSATVIAPSCMEADAIATACMAGTSSEAKDLLQKTNTCGMLIFQDSIWMSPGFKKYVSVNDFPNEANEEPGRIDRN